jgi:hypothetical protein
MKGNNMVSLFSRFGLFAVLTAFLLPGNVIAEIHDVPTGTVIINSQFGTNMVPTDSVEVNGGTFQNGIGGFDNRSIANIAVNTGIARNERGSTVTGLAQLLHGEFANEGTIAEGIISGGTFRNTGSITELLYSGGDFFGSTGSIGTLDLAGNASGINWGRVDHLRFDGGRSGLVTIAGFADEGDFGFIGLGMQGLQSVNMADGRFDFDFSGTTVDQWLGTNSWESIFGIEDVSGWETAMFRATWDDAYTDWFSGSDGWTFDNGFMLAFGADGLSVTPEPATLAIVGLGLVGLGYVRRRQKASHKSQAV